MAITLAEERQLDCPQCGESSRVPVWLAIDLRERPELRSVVADEATYTLSLPRCGHVMGRPDVIVVTNLDPAAPVLLGWASEKLGEQLRPATDVLLGHVHEQVRASDEPIPWPMLRCSFSVLRVAAQRDIGIDSTAPARAADEVEDQHRGVGPGYRRLLDDLQATATKRRMNLALDSLHRVTDRKHLDAALETFPELLSPDARRQLERDADELEREEERRFVEADLELLGAWADGDRDAAWARYEIALQATMEISINPELLRLTEELDAVAEHDPGRAVAVGERLLRRAVYAHREDIDALVSVRTAIGHLQIREGDRSARLERAIALLQRAEGLLERQPEVGDINHRRDTLANLAAALGERPLFDPIANQRRAIELNRRLLDEVTVDDDGDLWAKTHTNLATSLLRLAKLTGRRDSKGRAADFAEIVGHHELALRWRTYERDPLDWSFTHVNLATAHAEGGGSPERAIDHYDNAEQGFGAAGEDALRAQAVAGRASARMDMAFSRTGARGEQVALAREAASDALQAAEQLAQHGDRGAAGGAWWQVARAYVVLNADALQVRHALEQCLTHWTPETAPDRCLMAAQGLAALCDRGNEPESAADVWTMAADAAANTIRLSATREGRLAAVAEVSPVFRRAALALVSAGRFMNAIEVLELGRAQELAAWLERDIVEIDELRLLAPPLAQRYEDLRREIDEAEGAGADAGDEGIARASEGLAAAVQQIRRVPGHGEFLRRLSLAELANGSASAQTIAYPLIGQQRSCWLLFEGGDPPRVSLIDLPGLAARDVDTVLGGDGRDRAGYLAAVRDADRLDEQIYAASAALGATLMTPLGDELARRGCDEVCLVPLGLLGLLPLHALTWGEANTCLLDVLPVAYAPSGYARMLCERRVGVRNEPRKLVSLGNPSDDLDYAEGEARMVDDAVRQPRACC